MEYLWVLAPSAGVGLLFYLTMKALFNADRREREALAEAEREADQAVSGEQDGRSADQAPGSGQ